MWRTNELRLFNCFLHTLHVTLEAGPLPGEVFADVVAVTPESSLPSAVAAGGESTAIVMDLRTGELLPLDAIGDDAIAWMGSAVAGTQASSVRLCVFRCIANGPLRVKWRSQCGHGNGPPPEAPEPDGADGGFVGVLWAFFVVVVEVEVVALAVLF